MSSDSATRQWTLVLVLTALFLSLVVVGQILARYGAAYWAAPREIAALLDSADSSLQENESYDRDVAKVARRDDKIRLGRLLGEIQRAGDDLREDLNSVLVMPRPQDADGSNHDADYGNGRLVCSEKPSFDDRRPRGLERRRATAARTGPSFSSSSSLRVPSSSSDHMPSCPSPKLRASARILWASKRTHLEERLRRLDLLRMRFLVVYMSIVAATATAAAERVEKSAEKSAEMATSTAARATVTSAASRSSSSSSGRSSCGSSSCSSSGSSAANSPLISAVRSMPASPLSPTKTTASIVAASIAAAAAAALAAGDTDDQYYPASPTSMPSSPSSPGLGQPHPFLRSIQQKVLAPPRQPPSPPSTPNAGPSKTGEFADDPHRKPPTRRVATLGIRPPDATPENNHRAGWMGVVQELQRSPLLHKRHTSIEMSMARR
ncbi:hypothetical protein SCUCBS95973_003850 [Sporothrix curviconia]|uniref:Uncharacterized protein n=1 Tax=Sporothrix curviconia TaxID=1260050 RepID=A0ABP0BJ97_9PEZI